MIVANDAKQIIFNALIATLEEGDEVILPAPYFVSYPEMVKLLGGVPVIVTCPKTTGFKITPELLQKAMTARPKWLVLNMPGNPSAAAYSEAELMALGAVLAKHSLMRSTSTFCSTAGPSYPSERHARNSKSAA